MSRPQHGVSRQRYTNLKIRMNQPSNNPTILSPMARVLPIVKYPNPILQTPCASAREITPDLVHLAHDMVETMRASGLVGLAAPQVGQLVDLMVIDVSRSTRPSRLYLDGREISVASMMPLILFNTEINPDKDLELGFEGCGSIPGIRVEIERPASSRVSALTPGGQRIVFRCSGLLARVVQHEWDHLRGVLFIDRMSPAVLLSVQPRLDELQKQNVSHNQQ